MISNKLFPSSAGCCSSSDEEVVFVVFVVSSTCCKKRSVAAAAIADTKDEESKCDDAAHGHVSLLLSVAIAILISSFMMPADYERRLVLTVRASSYTAIYRTGQARKASEIRFTMIDSILVFENPLPMRMGVKKSKSPDARSTAMPRFALSLVCLPAFFFEGHLSFLSCLSSLSIERFCVLCYAVQYIYYCSYSSLIQYNP